MTLSTGSPGTREAVWPSGPRPRWMRSNTGGGPAGDASERLSISRRRSSQVGRFHRHGVDLLGTQRSMLEQTLAQMGEVSVRMPRWRHALVYLCHMYPVPRDIFVCQITQHKPWSMTAAHGQHEMAARG